ncbi:MAG: hypothetical protein H6814_09045 [Phycisphaeraceae bacterium]|nr:hypothetical protein [Phycisphaeraceae bacterium]
MPTHAEQKLALATAKSILADVPTATESSRTELIEEAYVALLPVLAVPHQDLIEAWDVAGRIAVLRDDPLLGAYAFESISRLAPDYLDDEHFLSLMAQLNRLGVTESAKGIAADRVEFLTSFSRAVTSPEPDPEFVADIARRYVRGIGVPMNRVVGLQWVLAASELGHVDSMILVARAVDAGQVEGTDETAHRLWKRAAMANDPEALRNLLDERDDGHLVLTEEDARLPLLLQLAESGEWQAMLELHELLKDTDPARSEHWKELAVEVLRVEAESAPHSREPRPTSWITPRDAAREALLRLTSLTERVSLIQNWMSGLDPNAPEYLWLPVWTITASSVQPGGEYGVDYDLLECLLRSELHPALAVHVARVADEWFDPEHIDDPQRIKAVHARALMLYHRAALNGNVEAMNTVGNLILDASYMLDQQPKAKMDEANAILRAFDLRERDEVMLNHHAVLWFANASDHMSMAAMEELANLRLFEISDKKMHGENVPASELTAAYAPARALLLRLREGVLHDDITLMMKFAILFSHDRQDTKKFNLVNVDMLQTGWHQRYLTSFAKNIGAKAEDIEAADKVWGRMARLGNGIATDHVADALAPFRNEEQIAKAEVAFGITQAEALTLQRSAWRRISDDPRRPARYLDHAELFEP